MREKKLTEPQPVWQEGIGSLLLLAAAHQTGFLATLSATIQGVASSLLSSGLPRNLAVVERLMLTLLFLPVAGLALSNVNYLGPPYGNYFCRVLRLDLRRFLLKLSMMVGFDGTIALDLHHIHN